MNNDRNFKNGGNEKNVGNVEIIRSIRTDIKYNNFLEPQARADFNYDETFWNGGNVSSVEKVRNIMTDRHQVSYAFETISSSRFEC